MLNQLLISGAIHLAIAMAVFFVIGLSARAAMLADDTYKLVMGLAVVVICFGTELTFTWFPNIFHQVYMHDVLVDILGALFGMIFADLFLRYRFEYNRPTHIANAIYSRYRRTDIYEPVGELD